MIQSSCVDADPGFYCPEQGMTV